MRSIFVRVEPTVRLVINALVFSLNMAPTLMFQLALWPKREALLLKGKFMRHPSAIAIAQASKRPRVTERGLATQEVGSLGNVCTKHSLLC